MYEHFAKKELGKFSVTTTKTEAGSRIIPMLPEVKHALFDEKAYPKEAGLVCQANIDGYTDFIFLNRYGNPHNPQTINRTIKSITLAYNEEETELAEKNLKREVLELTASLAGFSHGV